MLTTNERRIFSGYEDRREREAEGPEADVTCSGCDKDLEESEVHLVAGEACCAECALDEATRLWTAKGWKKLSPAEQIEILEAFQTAAAEVESAVRADLRRQTGVK